MSEPNKEGYWLPESYELKLTALEAGALLAILISSRVATFWVNTRLPDGATKRVRMIDLLTQKVAALTGDTEFREGGKRVEDAGSSPAGSQGP